MRDPESWTITSPKRTNDARLGWSGFFPYYAGFPEGFAKRIIESADLASGSVILDPWNGSGTTTYAAAASGYPAIGIDINPVMVIVARARLLAASEADTLVPLGSRVIEDARRQTAECSNDPLLAWFEISTATFIRKLEQSIRGHLVGSITLTPNGARLDRLSGLAAANYVALFNVLRAFTRPFMSSNPTWLKAAKIETDKARVSEERIADAFLSGLNTMAQELFSDSSVRTDQAPVEIRLGDAAAPILTGHRADLVLTSPPYCTRIDYTAATRVELAALHPMIRPLADDLRKRMLGTPISPKDNIQVDPRWGATCVSFLENVRSHSSRASSGYYYNTHLDYFHKLGRCIQRLSQSLKPKGAAVLVVQDSYYKDVHNDLPTIVSEMSRSFGLHLCRREDFTARSMSSINVKSRRYRSSGMATESVLCFVNNSV